VQECAVISLLIQGKPYKLLLAVEVQIAPWEILQMVLAVAVVEVLSG
jgi:hypothetical protein